MDQNQKPTIKEVLQTLKLLVTKNDIFYLFIICFPSILLHVNIFDVY